MQTVKSELSSSPLKSMLGTLRWIDSRLEYPERRATYDLDVASGRAVFGLQPVKPLLVSDHIRTDIEMARYFAEKALLDGNHRFSKEAVQSVQDEGYVVSSIVCVGDDVSSWIVIGKHFALEMRNPKFG